MRRRLATWAVVAAAAGIVAANSVAGQQMVSAVPLVPGLTVVTAVREPLGDYEATAVVDRVGSDGTMYVLSGDLPAPGGGDPTPVRAPYTVPAADQRSARTMRLRFSSQDPAIVPGTTAGGVSAAVLADIRSTGKTSITVVDEGSGLGGLVGGLLGNVLSSSGDSSSAGMARLVGGASFTVSGTIVQVGTAPTPVAVLVNDRPATLPARHVRGHLAATAGGADQDAELYILDDPANPIVLRYRIGPDSLTVVRIEWPAAATTQRMESELAARRPVAVYGIQFAFNSATIRPASDSLLHALAAMMRREPAWTLTITGHTDSIGGAAFNADLSERRAAAVKTALVASGVAASRLTSGGQGQSVPVATNATLQGRAFNRRVELTRQ